MRRTSNTVLAGMLCLIVLAGCRRDEIRTYAVKKEPAVATSNASAAPATGTASTADAAMRNTAVDTATGPALAWTAPEGWRAGPERPMRKATLLVPGADGAAGGELAVTAFPGDVGGNLANVNRWRKQLELPPIGEAELGAALQHLDVGSLHVDVVELAGPGGASAQRVLGAIVPYAGATWFIKLTGPDALVTRERERFLGFVRSLRPAS